MFEEIEYSVKFNSKEEVEKLIKYLENHNNENKIVIDNIVSSNGYLYIRKNSITWSVDDLSEGCFTVYSFNDFEPFIKEEKMEIEEMDFCVSYSNEVEWNAIQGFLLSSECEWASGIKWQKYEEMMGFIFSNAGELSFADNMFLKDFPEETPKDMFIYEEFFNKFISNTIISKQEKNLC